MFFEILLFTFIGILGGVVAGLVPGLHTNTLIIILFSILPLLSNFPLEAVIALIIAMAITSTIVDFIPSIFFGAPEDSTALSVLPGHKMLLEGKGLEAIYLTVMGGIGVVLLFVILTPVLIPSLQFLYSNIRFYIHYILIAIVGFLILTEKGVKKFWSVLVFSLSGILGLIVFNSILLQPAFVFFPLFTGLFGVSTLLVSFKNKAIIPKQEKSVGDIKKSLALSGIVKGFFSGLLVGILPGVGAAQASTLVQQLTRKEDVKEFLISLGGINTVNAIASITALYAINRARSGAAMAVERILGIFQFEHLLLLLAVSLISIGIASILTILMSKRFLFLIEKLPYYKLSLIILIFLIGLTLIFTQFIGLLVLIISTTIGLVAIFTGIRRSVGMGVIILPVVLFYAGLV